MLTPILGLMKLSLPDWSSETVKVYLVNGECVRTNTDGKFEDGISFTEGGNPYRYKFVPQGEIWLDLCEATAELPFTLIHELHESYLMAGGMDYDPAHDATNLVESYARNHLTEVPDLMKTELLKLTERLKERTNA